MKTHLHIDSTRSTLVLISTVLFSTASAQKDFRNRAWRDEAGGKPPTISMTDEGTLLAPIPQYVFGGSAKRGMTFCVVDTKNGGIPSLLSGGAPVDDWRRGFNDRWAVPAEQTILKDLFTTAGWDAGKYHDVLIDALPNNSLGFTAIPDSIASHEGSIIIPGYSLYYALGKERPKPEAWKYYGEFSRASGKRYFPLSAEGPLRFSVVRKVGFGAAYVQAWIVELGKQHDAAIIAEQSAVADAKKKVEDLLTDLPLPDRGNCQSKLGRWNAIRDALDPLYSAHNQLAAQWQVQWLWYTNGNPLVDPFGLSSLMLPPDTNGLGAEITKLKERHALLQKQLECCEGGDRDPVALQALLDARDAVKKLIDDNGSYGAAMKTYKDWLKANEDALEFAMTADIRLYDGLVYISSKDTARFMRHFDAARSFGPMNREQRTEFYDFEERHFIVHNFSGDPKTLSLEQTGAKVEHAPSLAEALNAPITGLTGLVGAARGPAGAGALWLAQLDPRVEPLDDSAACFGITGPANQALRDLQRITERLETMRTILSLRPAPAPACAFSFELAPKGDIAPQQHVSYSLLKKGEKDEKASTVAAGSYDLWKLHRFQLFGGMALSLDNVERTTITDAGGVIDIKRENERLGFVVGFKVHPWGAEIDDDRFLFHERRLSAMFGVGIPTPLNDLYAGIGYDLYPGVQVGILAHWYKNEAATIQNNKIVERRNVYADPIPALTLSIDSSLFTNLLKLLAP